MVLLISSTTHINKDVLWVILILIRAVFWCISVRITVSILPRHFLIFSVKLQRAPKQLLNIYTVIIGKTGHDLKWLSVKSQNLMLSPQQLNICTEIIGKTGYDFKSPSVKSQNLIQRNISAGYLLCRRLLFFYNVVVPGLIPVTSRCFWRFFGIDPRASITNWHVHFTFCQHLSP